MLIPILYLKGVFHPRLRRAAMGLWAYCSARVEQPSTVPANEVSLNIRRFLAGQRLKDRVLVFSHHRSHFECRRWISVSLAFEDIALIGFGFTFDALDYANSK